MRSDSSSEDWSRPGLSKDSKPSLTRSVNIWLITTHDAVGWNHSWSSFEVYSPFSIQVHNHSNKSNFEYIFLNKHISRLRLSLELHLFQERRTHYTSLSVTVTENSLQLTAKRQRPEKTILAHRYSIGGREELSPPTPA